MILGFLVTPYLVFIMNAMMESGFLWTGASLMALGTMIAAAWVLCSELRLSRWNAFLFPLGAVIMAGIMLNSMRHVLVKGQNRMARKDLQTVIGNYYGE